MGRSSDKTCYPYYQIERTKESYTLRYLIKKESFFLTTVASLINYWSPDQPEFITKEK